MLLHFMYLVDYYSRRQQQIVLALNYLNEPGILQWFYGLALIC